MLDPQGLVAFIVTVHESVLLFSAAAGALVAIVSAMLLRKSTARYRVLGSAALTLATVLSCAASLSHALHVRPFQIETVRIDQ